MKGTLAGKLTTTILGIVVTINTFMLIRIWVMMNSDAVIREQKSSYILPEGFTPEKTKIPWNDFITSSSGWVVRYASQGCMYCKLDFDWERLANYLEELNYTIIILLPEKTNQFDENQLIPEKAKQMAFVKMDWIKQFRFTGTPTTVIFKNNGRILWHHEGMLKEGDFDLVKKLL